MDWMKKQHSVTLSLFSLTSLSGDEERDKLLKPSVGGSKTTPPDKETPLLMTLCVTVKFINNNEADIDDSKWHHSYAAVRRSVWLHCGLLGKQALFFSLM